MVPARVNYRITVDLWKWHMARFARYVKNERFDSICEEWNDWNDWKGQFRVYAVQAGVKGLYISAVFAYKTCETRNPLIFTNFLYRRLSHEGKKFAGFI